MEPDIEMLVEPAVLVDKKALEKLVAGIQEMLDSGGFKLLQ